MWPYQLHVSYECTKTKTSQFIINYYSNISYDKILFWVFVISFVIIFVIVHSLIEIVKKLIPFFCRPTINEIIQLTVCWWNRCPGQRISKFFSGLWVKKPLCWDFRLDLGLGDGRLRTVFNPWPDMGPIGRVALVKHMKNKGSIKYIFSWFKDFRNGHSTLQYWGYLQ